MNPFKKLAGQTAIYGLPTIIGRLLNYLLVPLYTRIFVPSEYGVVTELYAYVAFLFVFLTYGMETAYFRFSTSESDKGKVYSTTLFSLLITSSFFVIISFILSDRISSILGYASNPQYIRWFVVILAADALSSIPYAKLRLDNKPLRFALIKIINISTNIFFNIFFLIFIPFLLKNHSVTSLSWLVSNIYNEDIGVGYVFISNLIASILTLLLLLPTIVKLKWQVDLTLLRRMLSYSWPLLVFGFAGVINETFDRIILKHLLPDGIDAMAQLGIYGACYKVSILMTLFIQTYRYAAEPFFFSHAENTQAKHTYSRLMHYFIIVCLFIFLIIMLNIDTVMLFVGEEYREGVTVIPILLWANLFLGVFYNLSIWFKLTDKTRLGALISICGAIITLVFNFILIPMMGYLGAAWATFICYGFMMVLSWYLGGKHYPINYNIKGALIYSAVTMVIYIISMYTTRLTEFAQFTVNTMLIVLFAGIIYFKEKGKLTLRLQ